MSKRNYIPARIEVHIPPDCDGLTGRECPDQSCGKYFKARLSEAATNTYSICPYCGTKAEHADFFTKDQIGYAKSWAMNYASTIIVEYVERLRAKRRELGDTTIEESAGDDTGPYPIRPYVEQQLETNVVCAECGLHYAIYGVFAFCPQCGQHNSVHILKMNLELAIRMLDMAIDLPTDLSQRLIENALEDCVSAFDGYGKEVCRVCASSATNPAKAEGMSFQNLGGARKNMISLFGFDLADGLSTDDWGIALRCFQKRHLVAHKMGVVDQEYVAKTGDALAVVGHKIGVSDVEVRELVRIVSQLGEFISAKCYERSAQT